MLNVLIAEGNVQTSVQLSNAINTKNVRCMAIVNDGTQLFQMIKNIKPDILILNMKLPGKSGFQVLEEISNDKSTKIQVMVYTSENEYINLIDKYSFICRYLSELMPYEEISRILQELNDKLTNRNIENKVMDILFKLGFTYSLKGTKLINDCIVYSIIDNIDNIKILYEKVSQNNGCNTYTLKSDINTAVKDMWKFTDREKARKILRIGDNDEPSNKVVIEMVKYYATK